MKDKKKKCKICKTEFTTWLSTQIVCSPDCAHEYAKRQREKKTSKESREHAKERSEAKERIKTRADWMKEAQSCFNKFIRARDEGKACISCGRMHQGQNHAGHFRTTAAAPELRFNELNVHLQCSPCNLHKHGNLLEYRIGLVGRLGVKAVEFLEGPHTPRKYTIDDLKAIKETYKNKLKLLTNKGK